MTSKILASLGLLIAAAGAFLLFRFGLPFRQRTGGAIYITAEQEDENEKAIEARADRLGWAGFALGIVGVALQLAAVWMG